MIKRLEQVAALVVAAGLAIVSYWLFFSWAQGGGLGRHVVRAARDHQVTVGLGLAGEGEQGGGDLELDDLERAEDLELLDYRVRVFQGGTDAVTRVLIESRDETGERWTTVGVSANIIDASFQALMDSIIYKLVRSGAKA